MLLRQERQIATRLFPVLDLSVLLNITACKENFTQVSQPTVCSFMRNALQTTPSSKVRKKSDQIIYPAEVVLELLVSQPSLV